MSLKWHEKSFSKDTKKKKGTKKLHTVLLKANKRNRFLSQKK